MDNSFFNCEEAMAALLGTENNVCSEVDPHHIAKMLQLPQDFYPLLVPTITFMSAVMKEILSRSSKPSKIEKTNLIEPKASKQKEMPKPLKVEKVSEPDMPEDSVPESDEVSKQKEDEVCAPSTSSVPMPPPLPADFLKQLQSTILTGPILSKKAEAIPSEQDSAPADIHIVNTSSSQSPTAEAKSLPFSLADLLAKKSILKPRPQTLDKEVTAKAAKQEIKINLKPVPQRQSKNLECELASEENVLNICTLKPSASKMPDINIQNRDTTDGPSANSSPESMDSSIYGTRRKLSEPNKQFTPESSVIIDPKLRERLNRQKEKAEGLISETMPNHLDKIPKWEPHETNVSDETTTRLSKPLVNVQNHVGDAPPSKSCEETLEDCNMGSKTDKNNSICNLKLSSLKLNPVKDQSNPLNPSSKPGNTTNGNIFGSRLKRRASLQAEQFKSESSENIDPKLKRRLSQQKEKAEGITTEKLPIDHQIQSLETSKTENIISTHKKPVILPKPLAPENTNNATTTASYGPTPVTSDTSDIPKTASPAMSKEKKSKPVKPPKKRFVQANLSLKSTTSTLPKAKTSENEISETSVPITIASILPEQPEKIEPEASDSDMEPFMSCPNSPISCRNNSVNDSTKVSDIPPPPPPPKMPSPSTITKELKKAGTETPKSPTIQRSNLLQQIKDGVQLRNTSNVKLSPKIESDTDLIRRALKKSLCRYRNAISDSETSDDPQDDEWD